MAACGLEARTPLGGEPRAPAGCFALGQFTLLGRRPSFLRKQESRPPALWPLEAGSHPAEGGHPGRHAGWKPALLQEERDALHSSVICSHDTICATRPGGVMRINLSGGQRTIFPSPLEGEGGRRPGEGATDPRRGLERFTISCSRARPRSSGKTLAGPKRPGRGWGGLPAWEGGHPGRHAGWKPALLQEERDALHSSVICSHDTICVTRPERGYALFPL